MNRGVFANASSALSRMALIDLQHGIAELRIDLARFAGAHYETQIVPKGRHK